MSGWSASDSLRDTEIARTGTTSLRLPKMYAGGVTQRVPIGVGALYFSVHLRPTDTEERHGRQYAKLDATVRNAAGTAVQYLTSPLYSLRNQPMDWRRIELADMITAADAAFVDCRIIVETIAPINVDDADIRYIPAESLPTA